MIIKFLANGTGDPQLAASYLIGEQDHLGDKRAGVEIVRGDPIVFAAIASSLNFKYCYTSVVINWSPEDVVSDEHLNEVLDLFEEHAFSGFRSDQYHMTAVMHADDDGSRHLHILIPRVELTTGKSLNVAPPGHRHYFDPLRDFLNHKYGWIRPDDPARMKTTKPKNHHVLQNASAMKAGLEGQAKKTRVEMIDAFIEQRIMFGSINNREELVKSLEEISEIGQVAHKSISLKYKNIRDRLEGEFYHAKFSFTAYREARTRQTGIRTVLPRSEAKPTECSAGLSELLERMETVRRKRAEYNQKYYRTKVPQNQADIGQATEISYVSRTTVSADFSREADHRHRVNAIPDKNGDAVSRLDEFAQKPNSSVENIPERECDTAISNITERGSASAVQQRTPEQHPANDGITQKNEPSSAEPRFEYGKAQSSDPRSIRKNSNTHRKDAATVIQSYVVAWDVRSIKHPYPNQTFHLNIGLTHERNTITDLKKPTDCPVRGDNSKSRAATENKGRRNSNKPRCDSRAESLHQRTREVAEATARLSRAYEERKLSYEQEVERYAFEVNRSRQDHQTLSSRTQQRNFVERTHRFFRNVKNQIGDTFRKVIDQFTDTTSDKSESRTKFETLSQCFDTVGIDRLVNIARQRTERRQRIENVKRFKQDLERIKEFSKQRLALNTISAELSRIQENFPELELRPALGFVSTAESCFHQFRDANKSDENIDLYLGEYVYSIDECFKLLEQKIITMQLEELEALKKLSTIIEDHLGQIQFESIVEDGVVHYESASQEVKVLVAEFRDKLGKRERVLINKMLSIDELSQSDLDKGRHKPDKLYNSDYDTFY
ncbi:relaxase/mobilization nuclease domain-containing protein [Acinetobacter gandensis]|uniref:relaxase/mobilization nuclease domain-containing protein n=1 Tax=Acinetobacter gandensis TaxID=1443941 RepID=UPI003F554EFB